MFGSLSFEEIVEALREKDVKRVDLEGRVSSNDWFGKKVDYYQIDHFWYTKKGYRFYYTEKVGEIENGPETKPRIERYLEIRSKELRLALPGYEINIKPYGSCD